MKAVRVMLINGIGERVDEIIYGENLYIGLTTSAHFPCFPFEEAVVIREVGEEGKVVGVFPREHVLGCVDNASYGYEPVRAELNEQ